LKNKFLYIIFGALLIIQGCCSGESKIALAKQVKYEFYLKLPSVNDTIKSVSYPNSSLILSSNTNQCLIKLSEAYNSTTFYINSTLGFDTVTILQQKEVTYTPKGNCNDEYFSYSVNDTKIVYHTFDSCLIKGYFSDYSKTDTLIIKK
jgi:hypothetical protein